MSKGFRNKWLPITTLTALILLIIYPWYELFKLVVFVYSTGLNFGFYFNEKAVIPFVAITVSLLVGYVLILAFAKSESKIIKNAVYFASAAVFVVVELVVDNLVARGNRVVDVFSSRAPIEVWNNMPLEQIPLSVRIHYYIFSVALVLIVLVFLNSFTVYFCMDKSRFKKSKLVLQGFTVITYSLAIIFVQVIQYQNYNRYETIPLSAVNAVACIFLASVSAGVFAGSIVPFIGIRKFAPPNVSLFTGILLYFAEAKMLNGNLYKYGKGVFFENRLFGFSLANIVILLFAWVTVYFLLCLVQCRQLKDEINLHKAIT